MNDQKVAPSVESVSNVARRKVGRAVPARRFRTYRAAFTV